MANACLPASDISANPSISFVISSVYMATLSFILNRLSLFPFASLPVMTTEPSVKATSLVASDSLETTVFVTEIFIKESFNFFTNNIICSPNLDE